MRPLPLLSLLASLASVSSVHADLISNPGFELGLIGWSVANAGSGDFYHYTGNLSPLTSGAIAAPQGGGFAVVTDQGGPGSHVLYQDFLVPFNLSSAMVTFDYFVLNNAVGFIDAGTLSHLGAANQHARVDLITTATVFGTGPTEILQNLLLTAPGSIHSGGWATVTFDATSLLQAHAGETLRFRFGEVDNQGNFRFGVDNVQISVATSPVAVSELSSTFGLLAFGLALLCAARGSAQWSAQSS